MWKEKRLRRKTKFITLQQKNATAEQSCRTSHSKQDQRTREQTKRMHQYFFCVISVFALFQLASIWKKNQLTEKKTFYFNLLFFSFLLYFFLTLYIQVAAIDPWYEGVILDLPGYPERIELTRTVPTGSIAKYKDFRERNKKTWKKKGFGCLWYRCCALRWCHYTSLSM